MIITVTVFLQATLRAICASAEAAGSVKSASSSMQSFYAVLVCELLLASQPVSCSSTLLASKRMQSAFCLKANRCGMMIMITITDII